MKKPEITWSLMHPTPLDPSYVRKLIKKAEEYHVDSFEICGQCHSPYGGLDGLISYQEFPKAAASWDQKKVAENQRDLNEILSIAHSAGKEVYLWHREVMLPPGLLQDLPDLLDSDGEFFLTGKTFAELIAYKLDKTFENVPTLDGIVLTLTEADYSAIHNSNTEKYPPVDVVSFIISIFASELTKRGKRFIMRSFGSIAEDYECILAGAEKLQGRYEFEIETKITPYDFDPFLSCNPFLRKSPSFTLSAECDCVGEFMGQGNMPFEHVHNIVRYVREGQKADVDRFVIRMDRRGNNMFDLYEINYYAYARALEDPAITAEEIREEWYAKHYPEQFRDTFIQLDKIGWEMVCKTYYIDHHVLFHGNYCMKYIKAAFIFALFGEKGTLPANGKGIWSILTDRPLPGRKAIIAEKEEAVILADRGLALLEKANPPATDFRWRLWKNAPVVTRAVLELVKCIAAYFDAMEEGMSNYTFLQQQVEDSIKKLNSLAGHEVEILKREFINGLEHRMKEVGCTIEELVLEPLSAICKELLAEFPAECAAKERFLEYSVDGIITGGISDDWRIARYMHASHSILHNNLPARYAGNRVFPNGFMEMELERGEELLIYGAMDVTDKFILVCDGERIHGKLDENGVFQMPLPASDKKVSIHLEKDGVDYPLFHAVLTRNKNRTRKKKVFKQSLLERELHRTKPDYILYTPSGDGAKQDHGNEHLHIFRAKDGRMCALWTMSAFEGTFTQRPVISWSFDEGRNWTEPKCILTDPIDPETGKNMGSWASPAISRSGRIYVLYNKHQGKKGFYTHQRGKMAILYSDDCGESWSRESVRDLPRTKYDLSDPEEAVDWVIWQKAYRLQSGKVIMGFTRGWLNYPPAPKSWTQHPCGCEFFSLDNIDEDPEPEDLRLTFLTDQEHPLTAPLRNYTDRFCAEEPAVCQLPDGRLFMVMRTTEGHVWYSVSKDDAATWRKPERLRYKDNGEGIKHPLSPSPMYETKKGEYVLFIHDHDGYNGSAVPRTDNNWRNPLYILKGEYRKDAWQPVWFSSPVEFMNNGEVALERKDLAIYGDFTVENDVPVLWYPDRKFFLLGKKIHREMLEKMSVPEK
ncbi:MAG: exo-alpha-sialidase [Lentisphaeria bacterium]|nr:exo-alpha-sialidase [Lentisphaeria bacterium]